MNVPPVVSAGGPYAANEGSTLTLHGSATDTPGETLTYSWISAVGATASGASPSIAASDGPDTQTETLTVCDDHGCASAVATIRIATERPGEDPLAGRPLGLRRRHRTSRSSGLHRPGRARHATGTWKVGAATLPATIAEHAGTGTASATAPPTAACFYPLSLTIIDKDGGTTIAGGGTLVVVDPNAVSVSASAGFRLATRDRRGRLHRPPRRRRPSRRRLRGRDACPDLNSS